MYSPFASRLGTNYCPQDEELAQIKALLIDPCLRLKSLDEEIAVMRKALDKLTEERDDLDTYVQAHKSLLSPFRRLPRDIIEVIFLACLPAHRNCVMSAQEAPVLLGRICSSWRAISFSAPRLWSRLHVAKPTVPYNINSTTAVRAYEAKIAQRLEVAAAWLRRSGTCPLSVSLQSSHHYDLRTAYDTSRTDPFMDILIPFASRWKDISVTIPTFAVQALLDLKEHDVPFLESLTITEIDVEFRIDPTWLSPGSLLSAARLSRFCLTGGDFQYHQSSSLPLSWSNLTSLTLMPRDALSCQIILDILARCSRLQTCKVGVVEHEGEHLQDSIVECLSLHSIEVWCYSSPLDNSGHLLSHLSVPNLQDFTLDGAAVPSNSISLLSSLATCTHLQSISITCEMFHSHELVDFLRGLPPTLQCLCIDHQWHPGPLSSLLDDNFFVTLETLAVLPALEELIMVNNRELSDEALLRFIISRMPTLRRVDIKFDREMQVDILPSLESFLESGAQVSLTYTTDFCYDVSPYLGLPDRPRLGTW